MANFQFILHVCLLPFLGCFVSVLIQVSASLRVLVFPTFRSTVLFFCRQLLVARTSIVNFEFEFFSFFCRKEARGEGFCCHGVRRFSLWVRPCERVLPFDGEVGCLAGGGLDGARRSSSVAFLLFDRSVTGYLISR